MAETRVANGKGAVTKVAKRTPAGQQSKKKKVKNAPDKPQPAWMFPPPEENPVLNPKIKSEETKQKNVDERQAAIKFLEHKAFTTPLKTAPPTQLLTLIGAFLASYGFNSTGRIFTLEREARRKLDGWGDHIGAKLDKRIPSLLAIYKDWEKDWQVEDTNMDSSDEGDNYKLKKHNGKMVKQKKTAESEDDTSSSGGSNSSDIDVSDSKRAKPNGKKISKSKVPATAPSDASSSSSDSDADDEEEAIPAAGVLQSTVGVVKTTVGALVRTLKRGVDATRSSDSSSLDSHSTSDEPIAKQKKENAVSSITKSVAQAKIEKPSAKGTLKQAAATPISRSNSSSGSSSSEIGADSYSVPQTATPMTQIGRKTSTDSSTTLNPSSPLKVVQLASPLLSSKEPSETPSHSSSSDSDSTASEKLPPTTGKRKRTPSPKPAAPANKVAKKEHTPFSRIPKDIKVDPKLASNAYQSYDYADRAHHDLRVTKGKEFTKEKNKKKRGS
jgi:hypothetical protein